MNRRHYAAAVLALAVSLSLLPGCRDKGSATPQAAQELAELRAEQELSWGREEDSSVRAEIAHLLSRFEKTADASLASSPHRITLLHLACMYKKPELARCLLVDGADPNARQLSEMPSADLAAETEGATPHLSPADTPLTWALMPQHERVTAEEVLALINILHAAGADVNQPGPFNLHPLALCSAFLSSQEGGEAVFLRLMELGARCSELRSAMNGNTAMPLSALVAANGWQSALERLLDSGATMATPARSALHAVAEHPERPGTLDCARLLLARGAEVNATNDEGATALYIAAHGLTHAPAIEETATGLPTRAALTPCADMIALLLQHGADPLFCCNADPDFPDSCASDFIAMSPVMQELLAEKGLTVPRRAIDWAAEGEPFLAELCRASLFGATAEEIAPHVAAISALLATPSPQQRESALYADTLGHAVILLARANAAHAAELVARLPLWQEQEAWLSGESRCSALMQAILSTPSLILPQDALLEHAHRMDAWGVSEVAAVLVELLERDPEGAIAEEPLCTHTSLPIRAGALTARLLRAGLPAPRNHAVEEWLHERGCTEAQDSYPPFLKRALLLTSLDDFWYGKMSDAQVRELLAAMRDIGAPQAAEFYAALAANLNNPEELDRLTAPGSAADTARYELECATALFLWSQREEWHKYAEAAANEPQN